MGRTWWRRRALWATAGVVVVTAGAGAGIGIASSSGHAAAAALGVRYVKAKLGTVDQVVGASGTIEPAGQAALDFAVAGTVTAVAVHIGETVSSGQALAQLSTTTLSAEATAAAAGVAADQARAAADAAAGASAAQQAADAAAVASGESQLSAARQALADATLRSPLAGTVAALNLTPGEQVPGVAPSASASLSGAQVMIITTNKWVVDAGVVDTQVGEVAVGDPATVVPAGSVTAETGSVRSVGLLASGSGGSAATYPVTVAITGDPAGLHPGAGAQVSLVVRRVSGVVTVPSAAVHVAAGGRATVRVRSGTGSVVRTVSVGLANGTVTEIRSGLSAGERVAVVRAKGAGAAGRGHRHHGGSHKKKPGAGGLGAGGGGLG
ncbi:MAG: efflux RND transporter periplasmic adaptor subunit [Actinomycetota bacterium]|nr:efflux RND transporter periplasmic adaptor subunit [Actinomycetota bacterium]